MMKFVLIILVWLFMGFLGIIQNARKDSNRINYEMIVFFLFVPFIPIVAMVCGLI